jgi:SAM-dependent methyltransferase
MEEKKDNALFYEAFDWEDFKEDSIKEKILKILEIIPEDVHSIIDIGCGNGLITNTLGNKYEVTAVDRSEKALSFVKTKKILASSDNIPLSDASFDMVFSSELLEHLDNKTFEETIKEFKRLAKKYIFITVPNDENPDKLSIQCPSCKFIYNSPNHLRSFKAQDFIKLFPEHKVVSSFTFGKKVRYYNHFLLNLKKQISPARSWIPTYWMPVNKRSTICPNCEHKFINQYKFNLWAFIIDVMNVIISPKKPYWLFILLEKK